jgi:cytochrome c oxidase cbb3-type subunit III
VADIETTILYGIRSGHPKSHNITDMPALGRIGQLSPAEIHDVVEFVYSLSHRSYDAAAAKRGFAIFNDKGACYDCHGADASGNIDYGAPDLTGKAWLYGGDRATLTETVRDGRHGLCPAWISRLTPAQVRALAVYLYVSSHPAHGAASR